MRRLFRDTGHRSRAAYNTSDATGNAITNGPDGAIWFADRTTHAIGRITTAGAVTEYPVPTFARRWVAVQSGFDVVH